MPFTASVSAVTVFDKSVKIGVTYTNGSDRTYDRAYDYDPTMLVPAIKQDLKQNVQAEIQRLNQSENRAAQLTTWIGVSVGSL